MTVYDVICDISKQYARFIDDNGRRHGYTTLLRFNLRDHSIYNGSYFIMKNGKLVRDDITLSNGVSYDIKGIELIQNTATDPYKEIEKLYTSYYFSVPSKTEQCSKCNFKALPVNKMNLEQIMSGVSRIETQYALEAYIIFMAVTGRIAWYDRNKFYWKSQEISELVLFREWIMV